jgi:predicted DCC family thiol-disulfide oxidoreductase YuxK
VAAATLIYDPDCGFCRWCLGKVLSWDRRGEVRPVPLGSPEADRLLSGMPREDQFASWHLVDGDGTVHSAGYGFPPLLRLLPVGGPLAAAAARVPDLTDRGYRWVAGHRSWWGKVVTQGAKRRADERINQRR